MGPIECGEPGLDQACLLVRTDQPASLYSLSSDCFSCPYSRILATGGENASVNVNTARSVTWRVYNDSGFDEFRSATDESGAICQLKPDLGEYGIYGLTIEEDGCLFRVLGVPRNRYTPLVVILGAVVCILAIVAGAKLCFRLLRKRTVTTAEMSRNGIDEAQHRKSRRRVLSIDTFRGISILAMIFVNNGAGGYVYLEHATWNGLLIGDLVFPCFVWIMGFCIPLALSSQIARGVSRFSIVRSIIKRSFLLFLIDLSVNSAASDADLKRIRIFGVLQRFAVAYLVVALLYTLLGERNKKQQSEECAREQKVSFAEFYSLLPQWIVIWAITAIHCGLVFRLPVPGCPTGYLGPGGRHENGRYWNCTGGSTGYVDRLVLGENHVYQRPTISEVYGSGPFDPEGILGCLTTILQTFLGVQAGKILRVYDQWGNRVARWLGLALICGSLGSILHFTDVIPVNKNLWSISFVLVTTSFALSLFTALYLLIDLARTWAGGPFRIPGMNALTMYVGHRVCYKMFPFIWTYGEETPESHEWRTIAAVWNVAAWTVVAYLMHAGRVYVSL